VTTKPEARVSRAPYFTGDGYGYGGGAILTIGTRAILFGEGHESGEIAERIARLWNANRDAPDPDIELPF
jgi:hypothetical protein